MELTFNWSHTECTTMLSTKPPHARGEATAYITMMTDPMHSTSQIHSNLMTVRFVTRVGLSFIFYLQVLYCHLCQMQPIDAACTLQYTCMCVAYNRQNTDCCDCKLIVIFCLCIRFSVQCLCNYQYAWHIYNYDTGESVHLSPCPCTVSTTTTTTTTVRAASIPAEGAMVLSSGWIQTYVGWKTSQSCIYDDGDCIPALRNYYSKTGNHCRNNTYTV